MQSTLTLFHDPIIEAMLATRPKSFQDLSQSDELKRLNRLDRMLKSSKKYKRMATENANLKWQSFTDQIDHDNGIDQFLNGENASLTTTSKDPSLSRHKRVSFADTVDIIPADYKIKPQVKTFHYFTQKVRKMFS